MAYISVTVGIGFPSIKDKQVTKGDNPSGDTRIPYGNSVIFY